MIYLKASNHDGDFDTKDYSTELSTVMWKGILISRAIDKIPSSMDQFIKPSIFQLTLRNMGIKN
jgi:hypothetical protein